MARKSNAAATPHNSTRGEAAIREYANSNLTFELSKHRAAVLLNSKELSRNILGLTPEDQTRFIDKADQVRQGVSFLPRNCCSITSTKAYPTVDSHNAKFVTALGNVCGATDRLPTSAVLTAGLEKRGTIAVASGGFTDIWRGDLHGAPVAIKAFRIYPAQNLKDAKEVRIQSALEVPSLMKFADFMEKSARVEEAIP